MRFCARQVNVWIVPLNESYYRMAITKEEVEKIATLANLELTPEEKESLAAQLSSIVTYIDKLNELDTVNVEPMSHCGVSQTEPASGSYADRDDTVTPCLGQEAVLKNAPVLLLDEATSSLDSESEQQIQKALAELATGRTVIAIAHRLSTVLSADQIIVMDGGYIKEIGTHAELLEKSGYYRRLYDHQFNRIQDEPTIESVFAVEELV